MTKQTADKVPEQVIAIFATNHANDVEIRELATLMKPALLGKRNIHIRFLGTAKHASFIETCCLRWGVTRAASSMTDILEGATKAVFFSREESLEFEAVKARCRKRSIGIMDLRYSI